MFNLYGKNNIDTDNEKINEILTRGVEDVFVKEDLEKKLKSGKQLRIKLGFDPTGSKIHIGRAIVLRKLRAFQDLGHKIVFIVGDFTAQVGDPSDKLSKRPMLSKEQIELNLKNYKEQIGKIINLNKAEFHFNSKWLSKLGFQEISELAECFSVQQMSVRRNFKERFDKGEEVSLREFLYPLMQGYDSVMVRSDVEIGGFDQLFNLKAGRVVQKKYRQEEQDVLTVKMLSGTDGRKMSTSWGNVINITDEPNDMFGKIMSMRDELMLDYFLLCTDISISQIEEIKKELENGENPRNIKIRLAKEIVSIYHNKEKADEAENNFIETFKEGKVPEDIKEVVVGKGVRLVDLLQSNHIVSSKSDYRRLINGGAIIDMETGERIKDFDVKIKEVKVLRVGKKRFLKIKIK